MWNSMNADSRLSTRRGAQSASPYYRRRIKHSPYFSLHNSSNMRRTKLLVFSSAAVLSALCSLVFLRVSSQRQTQKTASWAPLEPRSSVVKSYLHHHAKEEEWHPFRKRQHHKTEKKKKKAKKKKPKVDPSPWEETRDTDKLERASAPTTTRHHDTNKPDAIVIGSGLAGLSVALHILDRGGSVAILEKESILGGNSNKASSGINGCCGKKNVSSTHTNNITYDEFDSLESFMNDTLKSGGGVGMQQEELVSVLTQGSAGTLEWLNQRVGVDLSILAQLGGHSHPRTHRALQGMVGATIMYKLQRAIQLYETSGRVKILVNRRVTELLRDDRDGVSHVVGVAYQVTSTSSADQKKRKATEHQLIRNERGRVVGLESKGRKTQRRRDKSATRKLYADNIVLATGGFASDRSTNSLLAQYRPELLHMPATAGAFSTGDGIHLGQSVGADLIDMSQVQIHPTGWVDSDLLKQSQNKDTPSTKTVTLAAEVLRGVGGILLNQHGKRFCNELGTRDYVTNRMFTDFNETSDAETQTTLPTFALVLSSSAAQEAQRHVDMYMRKGLMSKLEGVSKLAEWMGVDTATLQSTLSGYERDAKAGTDQWGKSVFLGVPRVDESETFYAGHVTPVLHYCMGGLAIDTNGRVLSSSTSSQETVPGLYAVGEVSGGVHGRNRLGGNSLLECAVFGTIVGQSIPIQGGGDSEGIILSDPPVDGAAAQQVIHRRVSMDELAQHNRRDDCWIAIYGNVYDLTLFAAQSHPGGSSVIHSLAGKDATSVFEGVHSKDMLEMFQEEQIGVLVEQDAEEKGAESDLVTTSDLAKHRTAKDCWVAFYEDVYDLSDFLNMHPGGPEVLLEVCGSDGTAAFHGANHHTKSFLNLVRDKQMGRLRDAR